MIQLIGFLGCFYVFIRGLDIVAQSDADRHKETRFARKLIGGVACVGALGFAYFFIEQGQAMPPLPSPYFSS